MTQFDPKKYRAAKKAFFARTESVEFAQMKRDALKRDREMAQAGAAQ